jgi:undecaprenyl pyrophosphate phosphatase UppP
MNDSELQPKAPQPKNPKKVVGMLMLEAGTEFAFLIAVPLVAGLLAGKWLDNKTNHHFYVIVGILIGLVVTIVAISQRIKDYRSMLK